VLIEIWDIHPEMAAGHFGYVKQAEPMVVSGGTGSQASFDARRVCRFVPDATDLSRCRGAMNSNPADHVVTLESRPANISRGE